MNPSVIQTRAEARAGYSATGTWGAEWRHRACLLILAATVVGFAVVLVLFGWDYYTLSTLERPLSPKHAIFKPSGRIGLSLGLLGFSLFMLVYLYPLRKKWRALGRLGKTSHWMNYHVFLGLSAPIVISFHSAFKTYGFAGMAYWTMLALVASGIVGRYFYAQIPRNISAAEISLNEMQRMQAEVLAELNKQDLIGSAEVERLFRPAFGKQAQYMHLPQALFQMILWDVLRPLRIWTLRRRHMGARDRILSLGGIMPSRVAKLERAIFLASGSASLSKRIFFLAQSHRVFHLWHVIHRPFALSFAVFLAIHVFVVAWLGYLW